MSPTCRIARFASALPGLALAAALALGGCDEDSASAGAAPADASGWSPPAAGGDVGSPGGPATPPPPPEEERDFDLRTPEAGETRLYIPSSALDALVVVDAFSLAVDLVEVGLRPVLVRALPDDQGAVVLNAGTRDVSIVRPIAGGVGDYTVATLDVLAGHNALELSPDGAWALAWYAPDRGQPTGVAGSLQELDVIRLTPGQEAVFTMSVGLRPAHVFFAETGSNVAFVLCQDGISRIHLDTLDRDGIAAPIPVHDDLFAQPLDREVVLTPEGRYAVVRDLDRAELTLVDLAENRRHVLLMPDWPSDLDITPDGTRVVVPFRDRQEVAVIEVPAAFFWEIPPAPPDPEPEPEPGPEPEPEPDLDPAPDTAAADQGVDAGVTPDMGPDVGPDATMDGAMADALTDAAGIPDAGGADTASPVDAGPEDTGPAPLSRERLAFYDNPHARVAPTGHPFGVAEMDADGTRALLYTTLGGVATIGLLDLAEAQVVARPLAKEVTAAAISPDGTIAALLNRKLSGTDPQAGQSDAYTTLDLQSGYTKLILTAHEATGLVFTADGSHLYVLLPDPGGVDHAVHRVVAGTFALTPYELPDAPTFVGELPPAKKAAVMVDDPTGWLTFIDTETGAVDHVNSFELNSFIR